MIMLQDCLCSAFWEIVYLNLLSPPTVSFALQGYRLLFAFSPQWLRVSALPLSWLSNASLGRLPWSFLHYHENPAPIWWHHRELHPPAWIRTASIKDRVGTVGWRNHPGIANVTASWCNGMEPEEAVKTMEFRAGRYATKTWEHRRTPERCCWKILNPRETVRSTEASVVYSTSQGHPDAHPCIDPNSLRLSWVVAFNPRGTTHSTEGPSHGWQGKASPYTLYSSPWIRMFKAPLEKKQETINWDKLRNMT